MYVARACVCKVFQIYAHIRTSAPSCHVPDKRHRKTRTRRTSAHDAISHLLRQVHMCCVCRILYCSVLQRVAACCSVLQRVAACCVIAHVLRQVHMCRSFVHCIAACCSVLQRVAACYTVLQCVAARYLSDRYTCVAVCHSVLQRVAACCSVLQRVALSPTCSDRYTCVAVSYTVLQRVAACCSVLYCIAVRCSVCVETTFENVSLKMCIVLYTPHSPACSDGKRVLQCAPVWCNVKHRVAVCSSVLQCVAACCGTI